MAQIFRAYRFEIPVLIRNYGNYGHHQRYQCNHYDVLHIPSNATHKEIKDAYIKLSKEMHPDSGSKGSHAEFVKINEAYRVLSKMNKRQEYDRSLKYNNVSYQNFSEHSSYQNAQCDYQRYWDANMRNNSNIYWDRKEQNLARSVMMCLGIMFFGTIIQVLLLQKSLVFDRQALLDKSAQYQTEYEEIKREAKHKTTEEQLQRILELSKQYGVGPYAK
ncbi:uncharacterized protein LOC143377976 isoform X2 [Andrena cerasifolii]|uniref:uncharacterized protein LOC143377976 isoform X2 n=1 Tax=Andrena cerasifolii TaxID=2819439 RepID=UPI004037C2B4